MRPFLLLFALAACGAPPPLARTPETLAGVPLHHRIDGQRALIAVARLHQGGSTGIDSAWIAHYGIDPPSAMLYVGIADPATAAALVDTMRARIQAARTPFRYVDEASVKGRAVQVLRGQGQLHFVFAQGPRAVWLSADSSIAGAALADVLGLEPGNTALDGVPGIGAPDGRGHDETAQAGAAPGSGGEPVQAGPLRIRGLGPVLRRLVDSGALDTLRLQRALAGSRRTLTERQRRVLAGQDLPLALAPANDAFLLNTLWTVGLVNRNDILTRGPMLNRSGGQVGRFASTGGWHLSEMPATRVYASAGLIPVHGADQQRLGRVAAAVFRPCCDNATHFPDCNHGMAMLGLLTLLTSQGADEAHLFEAARTANEVWFPNQSRHIQVFLQNSGIESDRAAVGPQLASGSGHQALMALIADAVGAGQGGGLSC